MSEPDETMAGILATTVASFVAVPNYVNPGDEVTFYANASSSNTSATLRFVIYYDSLLANLQNNTASPLSINYTGTPGYVITKFTYDTIGNITSGSDTGYSVLLVVSDGTTTATKRVFVTVNENRAPYFVPSLPMTIAPDSGETVLLETAVVDPDGDSVDVVWDFGDGSPEAYDSTGPAGTAVPISQSHAWTVEYEPGRGDYHVYFFLNVTATDSEGNPFVMTSLIDIYVNYNKEPSVTFSASQATADPDDVVQLRASARDLEGDPITWTFMFNDSYEVYYTAVYHTEASEPNTTVWMNITHVFGEVGNYTVRLYVSDAEVPYQTSYHNLSSSVSIKVVFNTIPYVTQTIRQSPSNAYADETTGECTVLLSIQATDADGDVMSVTWDFGDGTETASNVSGSSLIVYSFSQQHTYPEAGLYNVTVLVTDGREGHDVTRWAIVMVMSNNTRPIVMGFNRTLSNGSSGSPGTVSWFTLSVMDLEGDPIEMEWDFGDGTAPVRVTVTEFDSSFVVRCRLNHTYDEVGNYTIRVWYTDHKFDTSYHNDSATCSVTIVEAEEITVRVWNWWDYTSLGLIFAAFGAVIVRWVYIGHKRRVLDRQGLSLEEYKIRQNERKGG